MRERIEKLAVMPFTISCATPSSTAIKDQHIRKPYGHGDSVLSRSSSPAKSEVKYGSVGKRSNSGTSKFLQRDESFSKPPPPVESSFFTIPISKSVISSKLQRFFKGLRALSQLFVYKEEDMQIGYPTDVKHVTHIGWDSSSGNCKSWIGELRGSSNRSSVNNNGESDLEPPRCSSWIEDAPAMPNWTSQDLLGTLGFQPEHGGPSPQFNLFKSADAKAEKAKAVPLEPKEAISSSSSLRKQNLHII